VFVRRIRKKTHRQDDTKKPSRLEYCFFVFVARCVCSVYRAAGAVCHYNIIMLISRRWRTNNVERVFEISPSYDASVIYNIYIILFDRAGDGINYHYKYDMNYRRKRKKSHVQGGSTRCKRKRYIQPITKKAYAL